MTLIKTKEELQAVVRSSTGLEIATIAPFLRNSEAEQEVIKSLGSSFMIPSFRIMKMTS